MSSSLLSVSPSHYRCVFDAMGYRHSQPMGKYVQLSRYYVSIPVMMINMNKVMLDCL